MKKIYLFMFIVSSFSISAQIEGTWMLSPSSGAMGCGGTQGDMGWWSSSLADVAGRGCIFDDSITFSSNGSMMHYMDGNTWLETWQGAAAESCGAPVAPHTGGSAAWSYSNNQLTINGVGAHLGLPKAVNGGELSDSTVSVPSSIIYEITMSSSGDSFTADIQSAGGGSGWWRFEYVKTSSPPPSTYNVTLQLDASNITVGPNGIYAGGGVLGGATAVQLTDPDGDDIWEGTGIFPPVGGNYVFLNSPANDGDWGTKEDLTGLPCADAANWNDRIMPALSSDITVCFEFGTCNSCGGNPPPPPVTHNVTFEVHTDSLVANGNSVSAEGIYIGGGFVGSNDALLLQETTNSDGKSVWSGSMALSPSGGHFTILNGICSDWSCKEDISGQTCADSTAYNDRNNLLGGFAQDTAIVLQYGSCERPTSTTSVEEIDNKLLIYPNPTSTLININSAKAISSISVFNMIGNIVINKSGNSKTNTLDVNLLKKGVYFISVKHNDESVINSRFIKK
jgi:hypothetical protein